MKVYRFLYIGFSLLLAACSQPANQPTVQKIYFDIPSFINQQISEIRSDSFIVDQATIVNGQNDEHILPWVDWAKEFSLFYSSDINKTAFLGKYFVDSSIQFANTDSAVKKITYSAMDSTLRTKKIEVIQTSDSRTIKFIHIINSQSNILSSTHEELAFVPKEGYIIKSFVHNTLFGENDFSIKGTFAKKNSNFRQDIDSPDQQ